MSRHVNINDLTLRVYDYCDIIIVSFFKSLIFRIFMCVHRQDVVFATIFLIAFHESYFLFAVSFHNDLNNSMIKRESQRIHIELM